MSTGGGTGGGGVKPKQPLASRIPQLGPSPAGPGLAPAPPSNGGAPGVGANSTGQVSSRPAMPSTAAFLGGDSTYQSQISQYRKALSDYMAQQNTQKTQYQNQYGIDLNSLNQSRQQAQTGIQDDFASRGLLNSGVYGKAYSDLQSEYDTRQTQLEGSRTSFLQQLNDALSNLKGQQQTGLTQAKQDAIARRAAGVGV